MDVDWNIGGTKSLTVGLIVHPVKSVVRKLRNKQTNKNLIYFTGKEGRGGGGGGGGWGEFSLRRFLNFILIFIFSAGRLRWRSIEGRLEFFLKLMSAKATL